MLVESESHESPFEGCPNPVLGQVLGVFSDEARWWAWKLDLVAVTVTLIFILPYSFFFLTLRHMDWPVQSALATAAAPLVRKGLGV